jgi:Ni,Fe-hydrogenase I small subunit
MSVNSGRVEVRYHGQWGTVCRNGWDMKDAEVVCRMLSYHGVKEYITTNFRRVKGIIWLDNVRCTGREISIVYRWAHCDVIHCYVILKYFHTIAD